MSDDLEFIVIDDIPEYIFCIGDDEENEQVIVISGKDGAFKYEKVAELPTTGEDGVLYLVPKSHTTQTASGNPINVNITDNAGKIESLKLDGDTFQQTYTGKNLFDIATASDVWIKDTGISLPNDVWKNSDFIKVEPNTTYTMSGSTIEGGFKQFQYHEYSSNNESSYINQYAQINLVNSITFTTHTGCNFIRVGYRKDALKDVQLEAGSTATAYEPYVGGTPSPSPEFPQPIQTVTGTQTISINGTDYPLDLGAIELCKLGSYQDYIYKDGDDWKVHKATSKTTITNLSTITGVNSTSENTTRVNFSGVLDPIPNGLTASDRLYSKSDHFSAISNYNGDSVGIYFSNTSSGDTWFRANKTEIGTTEDSVKAWLVNNPVKLYYPIPTATDTVITDQTLIAQLEAVRTASLETGTNTISNTATGTNLAGDLELGYYGYDPLNKYDKYFWLDVDGAYESL